MDAIKLNQFKYHLTNFFKGNWKKNYRNFKVN